MITFTENTIGVWYVQLIPGEQGQDFLGSLWRDDDGVKGRYRFRYYRGDQALEFEHSEDEKNWYDLNLSGMTEQFAIDLFRKMVDGLAVFSGGEKWELLMGTGGVMQFADEFAKLPFATMQVEKVEP